MAPRVRTIEAGEIPAFVRSEMLPFHEPLHDAAELAARVERVRPNIEPERTWVVDDGGFVGNAGILTRTVTLPGLPGTACPVVPMAAVTAVGVHPTHRRRGLLRQLMGAMLADARTRGEPVAGLLASESSIYGRFGFGWATNAATYAIDTAASAFRTPVAVPDLTLVGGPDAAGVVPAAFERGRLVRAGQIDRPAHVWNWIFSDPAPEREGRSALTWVVCDGGAASWRSEEVVDGAESWARIHVKDLVGETPETEAALWRFLLDLDLAREVRITGRPLDEAVRHRLVDPRRLRTLDVGDRLWVRVLDTPAALTARRYLRAGRLVLDVVAPPATPGPDGVDVGDPAAGRWVLEVDRDGSACKPAEGERADVTVGLASLGSLLMGGIRATTLAAAGLLVEDRPGALIEADGLFTGPSDPVCATGF